MTRVPALGFKPANSDGIPEAYHLVQKKIILDREHLDSQTFQTHDNLLM